MRSLLSRRAKTVADEALLRAMSAGGGGGGGGFQNVVYVTPTGSDSTGDGSFARPFASITKALSSITTASASNLFTVLVGPGIYTENIALKASVSVQSLDVSISTIVNGNITLDPSWSAVTDFEGAAFSNFVLTGIATIDWASVSQTQGYVYFFNDFIDTVSSNGFGPIATSNNSVAFGVCQTNTVNASGVTVESQASTFYLSIGLTSTATLPTELFSESDSIQCPITLTGGAQACSADLNGTGTSGTLTLNGPTTRYTSTSDGIPSNVVLTGGAAPPVPKNSAPGVGYTAGAPANWVAPPPTTIQQALDRIAANVANAHPIP